MARSDVALLSLAIALTACAPPSPGPHVQGLLDEYAPELTIGATLTKAARATYRLEASTQEGYLDNSFVGRGGLFDLLVRVDQPIEVLAREVKGSARITSVEFQVADPASIDQLRARFDSALGTPTPLCYANSAGSFRYRYWPGMRDRGIGLRERLGSSQSSERGVGSLTFGSAKFHPDSASIIPCR